MADTDTAANVVPMNRKETRDAEARALASMLVDRAMLAMAAGYSFGEKRDVYEAFGYPRKITAQEYRDEYERGGIAQRLVNAFPHSTWRGGGEVIESEDPEVETEFEKAFFRLNIRFDLWSLFKRADILASLGRYACVVVGAPGDWETPLTRCPENLLQYFAVHSEASCVVESVETNKQNPRFSLPTFYTLTIKSGDGKTNATARVHYTRIIHVPAEGELDEPGFGQPKLKVLWNLLQCLEKVAGGGSEAYFKRVDGGKHIKLDPNMPMPTDDQLKELNDQLDEYTHKNKRILKTRGVDIEDLGSTVANFGQNVDCLVDLISATSGIPQRILMGSERGELASTTDQSNYDDRVTDRRNDYAETKILRPFVDRMIELTTLPAVEDYQAAWPEEDDMDDVQRMDLASKAADVNQKAGQPVILPSEIRDRILGYPPIEEVASEEELLEIEVAHEMRVNPPDPNAEKKEKEEMRDLVRRAARSKDKRIRMLRLTPAGRKELKRRKKKKYW